jgi:hypothetical protein
MSLETKARFEILIAELLDNFKITTSEELTEVMEELHQCLENGAYDYAIDLGIYDDYEPSY